ncbi:MAG: Autotransporter-associated beta strand repeat protein, partial [Verrucomicrobiaceae bacterium]|nr:Autotransporter-associated beta strand repeat protein [Verrucomicrobiaceae bacterium]
NFTGAALVNRGSSLEMRGTMTAASYETFGTLNVGGSKGTFFNGVTPITVLMRPGSEVGLRNDFDLLPVASTEGRYGDTTPVNLKSSTLRLVGSNAADIKEVVGAVTVSGGSLLIANRNLGGRITELNIASLTRTTNENLNGSPFTGNNGTVSLTPSVAGQLGSDERITVAGASLAAQVTALGGITNGQLAPWMWNQTDAQFVTYSDFGFVNAGFTNLITAGGTLAASVGATTDRLLFQTTAAALPVGGVVNAYSLRSDVNLTLVTATDTTAVINLGSGGLIANGAVTISPKLNFASGGEAVIYVTGTNTLTIGDNTIAGNVAGQILASSINKSGSGTLSLTTEQGTFAGNIVVNAGGLTLRNNTTGNNGTSKAGGNGGTIVMNGANTSLNVQAAAGSFANSIAIADGNPLVNITVDRIGSTTGTNTLTGGLTFGGAPGDQGQTINFTQANNQSFQLNGTTNLGPVGNAVINVVLPSGNTGVVTLGGGVATTKTLTGAGTLVKAGGGQLNLGLPATLPAVASDNTGGIVLEAGTLQGAAVSPGASNGNVTLSQFGSGNISLLGGQLNLRVDGDANSTNRTYLFNSNSTVNVVGNTTISTGLLVTAASTGKTLAFSNLNIGGQTLVVNSPNAYSLRFNAASLTGTPTFNTSNDLILSGVTDNGGNLSVVKNGAGSLWFDDRTIGNGTANAISTFTGGLYINAGLLRFGNVAAVSNVATAGTGTITINPGAQVRLESANNINTGAGQSVVATGINPSMAVVRVLGDAATSPTQLAALLSNSSSTGKLLIEATYAAPLNLATIGDGSFYFGSQAAISYTANSLGVGTGNTYRIGANDAAGSVLTLAPVATASNVLTGANKLVVGSLANNGTGIVFLNQTNSYTGGTTVGRGSEVRFNSGGLNTPLGTGQVDVFGLLRAENANGSFKNNTILLHPGATLRFENSAANNDRWTDSLAIPLNGATLLSVGLNNAASTETIGGLSFAAGSRVQFASAGTGRAEFVVGGAGTVSRVGNGTLVFVDGGTGRLGTGAVNNGENFTVAGGVANVAGTIVNGMLPAYYIAGSDNSFVTYNATGFNRVAFTNTNFGAGFTNASIVDVAANTTLTTNPSIYAMRVGAVTINNGAGQFNTITLNGAGTANSGGGIIFSGAGTINPNLNFNGFEGLIYTGAAGVLNGDISGVSAAGITKFGSSSLQINKDQSDLARGPGNGYSNGWTVNEGTLIVNAFGALGNAVASNTVTLNGSVAGPATLTLQANQGSALNEFYSMGNLQVTDNAVISYAPGAVDRTQSLGAPGAFSNVTVNSTGGSLLDARLAIPISTTNFYRTLLQMGDVTASGANASVILDISQSTINNNLTSGVGVGVSIASLKGTADQTFKKWGNAELYIRNASTFAGSVSVEQGPVGVFNNGSLGTGAVTIKRYGTLDIWTPNFTPTNSGITYEAGSIERWSVNNARTGTLNLGGATLQINNDQTGTVAVTLNGGAIEGFLKVDDNVRISNGNQGAVYRTLGAGVTFNLAGNSFLGQNINLGVNGLDNGAQANPFQPFANAAAGVLLEIKGAISGLGGLTKQGYDTVTLSGLNTYSGGTSVVQGMLRLGVNDALLATGNLSTSGAAVFDLNGYNQTIG